MYKQSINRIFFIYIHELDIVKYMPIGLIWNTFIIGLYIKI